MSIVWGVYLRDFRERTGLTQGEFSDAMSLLWLRLSDAERESLSEIGVDHLDLGRSDISRYENGHRRPRSRSRGIALIYALYKLNGIQNADEANEWLRKADQGPLTAQEHSAIFGSDTAISDTVHSDTDSPRLNNTAEPKQSTDAQQETQAQVNEPPTDRIQPEQIQPELMQSEAGMLTTPDTIQRLSALLKEPYSLAAILLLIAIGLFTRGIFPNSISRPAPTLAAPTLTAPTLTEEAKPGQTQMPFRTPEQSDSAPPATPVPTFTPPQEAAPKLGIVATLDFEAGLKDDWSFSNTDQAEHLVDVKDGALCSEIITPGEAPWHLTMRHNGFPLKAHTIYQLTFDVSTTADRNLSFGIREKNGYHLYNTEILKAGTQSVEVEIRQNIDDEDAGLVFWPGGQTDGPICIDNIVLSAVDTFVPSLGNRESRSAVPENLIPSATFDEGFISKHWWFSQRDGAAYKVSLRDGALCATITHPGNDIGDLVIGQNGLTNIVSGTKYRLIFDVFSKDMDALQISLAGALQKVALSPEWSVIDIELVPSQNQNETIMLQFGGQPGGMLCIDNLLLVDASAQGG